MKNVVIFVVAAILTLFWCAPAPAEQGKVTIKRDSYGVPHVYAGRKKA